MSSIAFHSPDRDVVRVAGVEGKWSNLLCARVMKGVLGLGDSPTMDRTSVDRLLRMRRWLVHAEHA